MSETRLPGQRAAAPASPSSAAAERTWWVGAYRLPTDSFESLLLSLAALALAAMLFGGFVALQGHDPLAVYQTLYLGAFGTRFSIENTLTQAAPLLLTALCTLIPARVGLLVIGGEGAVVVGGLGAVLAGVALAGVPASIGTTLTISTGALAGGLWIAAAGALKHLRGVNETISTLLMNYIAIALMNHLISGPIRDFSQTLKAQSWSIPSAFMVGNVPGWSVHWGLAIGLVTCVLLHLILRHTTLGFSMDILGGNRRAALMAGLPIGRLMLLACFLGGAAAGIAGAVEIVAVHGAASESLVVGLGYTGILVAFLARQNAVAVILVALLLGGISASGGLLQRRFDMPHAATTVLQGLIFICVLASSALTGRLLPRRGSA
jgi:general nucleoside transport system permease protein